MRLCPVPDNMFYYLCKTLAMLHLIYCCSRLRYTVSPFLPVRGPDRFASLAFTSTAEHTPHMPINMMHIHKTYSRRILPVTLFFFICTILILVGNSMSLPPNLHKICKLHITIFYHMKYLFGLLQPCLQFVYKPLKAWRLVFIYIHFFSNLFSPFTFCFAYF